MGEQSIPRLPCKCSEIPDRARIGRQYTQHLTSLHVVECFLGFQYWQGTFQAARIHVPLEFHTCLFAHLLVFNHSRALECPSQ